MNIEILHKNTKRLTLKIHRDGHITLSAPFNCPQKEIDNFLLKNESWIKGNYYKVVDLTLFFEVKDNTPIYLLGKPYIFRIILSNKSFVELNQNYVDIYVKEMDQTLIEKTFNKFYSNFMYDTYKSILDKYLNLTGLEIMDFKIKPMKSALGKCSKEKRAIFLSSSLIHKEIPFIEAVVMHEVAHLKYSNHQKEFYDYINKYMSDYKNRMKKYL